MNALNDYCTGLLYGIAYSSLPLALTYIYALGL
jgi:hypothetical protein